MTEISLPFRSVATNRRGRPLTRRRSGVPWSTVLPLAIVLAYADGFWVTSLRGAVGAIQTTQSPFTTWWHESTLVVPVYVVAVLGALMLAQRWFGPVLRRPRTIVATVLLIVAATTVVSLLQIVAAAAYDYHLQSAQLRVMDAMMCVSNCLPQQQHDTLVTWGRGALYVSRWLVLSNVVLAGWLVAMRGGRLTLSTATPSQLESTAESGTARNRLTDFRLLLVAGLVGSAAIHAAVIPEHLQEWTYAGTFFIVLTAAELGVAALVLMRPSRRLVLLTAAVISIGPLLVWLCSRTAGLPFGPEAGEPEAIGLPDVVACALEFATLVTAFVLLRAAGWLRRPAASAHLRALTLAAVIGVTVIGLAGVGPSWYNIGFSSGPGGMPGMSADG
jgi:hypothetical protein